MTDEQEKASEKKERVRPIDFENVEFEFVRKVERRNRLDQQNLTTFSEPCTPHKSSSIENTIKSVGETPIQGSESIVPVAWVDGPPTQVQQMSQNSAALALLSRFAEGRIQMQRETVKHLSKVHMGGNETGYNRAHPAGWKIGQIKIEKVNFLDWSEQKELVGDKMLEAEIKKSIDSNLCSMGKQKKGRDPDKLLPVAKNRRAAEAKKRKSKPLPKSGLGSEMPAERKGLVKATRSSPRNKLVPPLKTTATETPARWTVRKSPRFKETLMTPTTPMPLTQVRSKDDEPTFPTKKDPIR